MCQGNLGRCGGPVHEALNRGDGLGGLLLMREMSATADHLDTRIGQIRRQPRAEAERDNAVVIAPENERRQIQIADVA